MSLFHFASREKDSDIDGEVVRANGSIFQVSVVELPSFALIRTGLRSTSVQLSVSLLARSWSSLLVLLTGISRLQKVC